MNKLLTSAAFLLVSAFSLAQESYTIKMNMKIEGLPPEYAGFGEQEIVSYSKGDKFKQEMTSMMGSQIISFDGKTHYALFEQMGEKSGFTATKEEMEADQKKDEGAKPKIEYTAEKKMIAGYECNKAIVTPQQKEKKEKAEPTIVWFTEKLKKPEMKVKSGRRGGMGPDLGDLKGMPLEIEMTSSQGGQNMKVMLTASEVSTGNIDDKEFTPSTEGYKLSTYKEFKEKMKAQEAKGQ